MNSKLDKAEYLIKNGSVKDGVDLFNKLLFSPVCSDEQKLVVLNKFMECNKDEAEQVLYYLRDSIPFLKDEKKRENIDFLKKTLSINTTSHQKILTAVTLYNYCLLTDCYDCFEQVAKDSSCEFDHRVEAIRFLYANIDTRETALALLKDLVQEMTITSKKRYEAIASFTPKTGIRSFMNMHKILIPYDENFVLPLQKLFFSNKENQVEYRILAGQFLLQNKRDVYNVSNSLLEIARNDELSENIRADAADVVLRSGVRVSSAEEILYHLGNKKPINDVYSNSQNAHSFSSQVLNFVEKIQSEFEPEENLEDSFHQVYSRIRNLCTDKERQGKVKRSIDRISIDGSLFTTKRLSLTEIFVLVFRKIQASQYRKELETRLVEELEDMADTCSTGHINRLVNIFSGYELNFRISWFDQIKANLKARLEKRIKEASDQRVWEAAAVVHTNFAEEEDIKVYTSFTQKAFPEIQKELYSEFVEEGYLSSELFHTYFSKAVIEWEVSQDKRKEL